jgi:hypothetical protein
MTARKAKAAPAPTRPEVPELTAQDCHNIVQLLNRVQTNGIQEAQVLLHVAGKLSSMKMILDPNQEIGNGEDATPANK